MARCVLKRPGKPAEIGDVELTLEGMQAAVAGYIEPVRLEPGVVLFVNEEGKLRALSPNVELFGEILVGTLLVLGEEETEDGLEERALSEEQAARWKSKLDAAALDPTDFAVPN